VPLAITATADVSNDKADNTISVSADKGTQTAEADLTEISACSDAYDGKLPTAEKKFHRDAYLQQQNRQINAVKLQTSVQSKNFTEKCKATVSVPKVEINKGCTPGKAEIKMKRPSELAVSARTSEINARTRQNSQARRRRKKKEVNKNRRPQPRDSAKQSAKQLDNTEVQSPNTTTTTSETTITPGKAKTEIIETEKSSPYADADFYRISA